MAKKTNIIMALGSNTNQESCMSQAKQLLNQLFQHVVYSSDQWTIPIGIQSDKFLNCLAYATTNHGYDQIKKALKRIERRCGVSVAGRQAGVIQMDIDILLFDDKRYHETDWDRPYIRRLMNELKQMFSGSTL